MPIAIRSDKIDLSSKNKTKQLAILFSKKIRPGNTVFLYGEMGVGKTTFIRYFINELQNKYKKKITEVTSPTFNLLNQYQINRIKINHYDLFRVKSADELKNLNLFDDDPNIVTLIEWPQIIKKKPKNLIELNFEYCRDYQKRSVKIKGMNL